MIVTINTAILSHLEIETTKLFQKMLLVGNMSLKVVCYFILIMQV